MTLREEGHNARRLKGSPGHRDKPLPRGGTGCGGSPGLEPREGPRVPPLSGTALWQERRARAAHADIHVYFDFALLCQLEPLLNG